MRIGKNNPDQHYRFALLGGDLELVDEEKDIGANIDSDLSFEHICEKV